MIKSQDLVPDILTEGYEDSETYTHKRLRDDLSSFAHSLKFCYDYDEFPNDKNPDVLLQDNEDFLFMGDAKVTKIETVSDKATVKRVFGYIDTFFEHMNTGKIGGGVIAISTDEYDAAKEWKEWLEEQCRNRGYAQAQADIYHDKSFKTNFILVTLHAR